jgi:WD40 repeat protein
MNLFYLLNDRTYGQKTTFASRQFGVDGINREGENCSLRKYCPNFESLIYPNKSIVGRLEMTHKLKKHTGCVNTASWSSCGRYLLTGSDDTHICIWDWENNGTLKSSFGTGHTSNIFCAKFIPFTNNSRIITCARDGLINVFDLEQSESSLLDMQLKERFRQYKCHKESVKKLVTYDDNPHLFLSCSNDGTVRLFDLRESKSSSGKILVNHKKLQFNSLDKSGHLFCIGASDPIVRVYDMRHLPEDNPADSDNDVFAKYCPKSLVPLVDKKNSMFSKGHVTGVAFRSSQILATYSGESVYLFDINTTKQYFKHNVKKSVNESDLLSHNAREHMESPLLSSLENLAGDNDIYGKSEEEKEETAEKVREEKEQKEIKDEKIVQEMEVENHQQNDIHDVKDDNEKDDSYACEYKGHCNMRTVKSVSFFGPHQEYVMSGSDDGNIFIWDKLNGTLINLIKGDKHVVNVLSGHPFDPILATVGIDNSVKIFSPTSPQMNSLQNSATTMQDNLDRLESGPVRPMAIPMALLRRLFQSVHEGTAFAIDSSDDENEEVEVEGIFEDDISGRDSEDDSDENGDWAGGRPHTPDACPMQ